MTQAPKTHPHHQEKHNLSHRWILFFRSRVFARVYTLSVVRDVTSLLIGRFCVLDTGILFVWVQKAGLDGCLTCGILYDELSSSDIAPSWNDLGLREEDVEVSVKRGSWDDLVHATVCYDGVPCAMGFCKTFEFYAHPESGMKKNSYTFLNIQMMTILNATGVFHSGEV